MDKSPGGNLGVVMGLMEKINDAEKLLLDFIPRAFPIGMRVHWEHGHHIRDGVVDYHSDFIGRAGDVRVELNTGSTTRVYWFCTLARC